jgi:hypothetical protein
MPASSQPAWDQNERPWSKLFGILIALLSAVFLLRFGLLSFLVMIVVARAFTRLPITLDASAW